MPIRLICPGLWQPPIVNTMTLTASNFLKVVFGLAVLSLLAGALFGIYVTTLPFESLKATIDQLAVDGDAEFFTREIAADIQFKLLLLSFAALILIPIIFNSRTRLDSTIEKLQLDFKSLIKEAKVYLANLAHNQVRNDLIFIAVCIGIAFYARCFYLFREIYYDEAFTFLSYAVKPLVIAISNYSEPNNHLLHTALLRLTYLTIGYHEWALRIPAFIAGLLILPALYLFAFLLKNRRVAFYSTALACPSVTLIEYSTLARGYSLLVLLFLVLCSVCIGLTKRPHNLGLQLIFIATSAAGFFTIPIFLYGWISLVFWMGLEHRRNNTMGWRDLIAQSFKLSISTTIVSLACYLPALVCVGLKALVANTHVETKGFEYLFEQGPASLVWTWESWNMGLPLFAQYFFCLMAVLGLTFEFFSRPKKTPLLAVLATCSLSIMIAQQVVPFRRVWLFLLPVYFVYVASGLDIVFSGIKTFFAGKFNIKRYWPQSWVGFQILICLILVFQVDFIHREFPATFHTEQGTLRDAKQITTWISPLLKEDTRVLAIPPADYPLRYHFFKQGIDFAFLDPKSKISGTNKVNQLILIHNLSPNFSKAGTIRYEAIEEILQANDRSSLLGLRPRNGKQFPFASVYLYAVE